MIETLQERLIRHEGLRLFPYHDTLGFKTIGVGHKVTPIDGDKFDKGITYQEAMALLDDDILEARMAADKSFPWTCDWDDARKDVIIEMVFQLGLHGVKGFTRFLNAANRKDWDDAADEMLNSAWHTQTPDRCEELAEIMLNGITNT